MLDGLDDLQVMELGFIEPGQTPAQARVVLASRREYVIDILVESQMDGNVATKTDKSRNGTRLRRPSCRLRIFGADILDTRNSDNLTRDKERYQSRQRK